ncbi:DNA repair protein RAD16 [Sugiyamaella lignohabitans]|uniref:DNA repair protein RAD16 n=1 Tax=Sugiyamaella lignohabitans TaxID=796027 RepID=A0A161HIE7_9ASCO|nr:DNA repair protein RAD16 [Sugiyamaella lignohabitans]ANB12247.1 DNA repair protein RAD16 [Sugiyamaella lignohabitans]
MAKLSVLNNTAPLAAGTKGSQATQKSLSYRQTESFSDNSSESEDESDSDSENESIQQVMGTYRKQRVKKIIESDSSESDEDTSDEEVDTVKVSRSIPSPSPAPKSLNISRVNGTENKIKAAANETAPKPTNQRTPQPGKATSDKEVQDISEVLNDLSIKTADVQRKEPQSSKKPVKPNPVLKPWAGNRPVQHQTANTVKVNPPAQSPVKPKAELPKQNNTVVPGGSFFDRIKKAQEKQSNSRLYPSASLNPPSDRAPFLSSPIRNYKSDGTLMEPMTPRSSQWSRPIDIAQAKSGRPVTAISPIKPPGDDDDISPDAFRNPLKQWGTTAPSIIGQANLAATKGDSYAYVDPAKTTEALKSLLTDMSNDEDINQDEVEDTQASKVEGLTVSLLSHQIKGLKFLLKREDKDLPAKGGLLCDDMGLGKTVQSIALILSNPYTPSESISGHIRATLVIAPLALAEQWADEIRNKAPGLRVEVHHGPSRSKDPNSLNSYDVVITTYQTATSEHQNKGPLFQKTWWRIILDEAHMVKNPKAKSSIAAYSLQAQNRWCLTGTPIQNNIDELYSLIKFLQIAPLNNASTWHNQIARPITNRQGNAAINRLRAVLSAIMLRRTKAVLGQSGIKMPARRKHFVHLDFDENERVFYDALHNRVSDVVKRLLGESGRNYMGVLLLLLRLRQVCDDKRLSRGKIDNDDKESIISADKTRADTDDLSDLLSSMSIDKDSTSQLSELGLDESESISDGSSTKIKKIIEIVKSEPERKTIIFSQFTSMLDLIEKPMRKERIKFVRYDGSMTKFYREAALSSIKEDPSVKVLLCSLKCGAYGLNLTCANRVILTDPWWNPMVEEQAIDRVHRLGQTHDVDVYELIIRNTVEDKIIALQEKKRQLSKDVIEGGKLSARGNQLSAAELLALFD